MITGGRRGPGLMPFVADNSVVLAWFVSSQSTASSEKMLRRVAREPIHVPVVWSPVLLVEIAEVTPPVGFNLFVLQNMTGKDSNTIAKAAIPFFFCLVVCIVLITVFPQIVTVLPDMVMGKEK